MRSVKAVLFVMLVISGPVSSFAQSTNDLIVDFGINGFAGSPRTVTLAKGSTYYFQPFSRHLCTFNSYTWFFSRSDGRIPTGITINGQASNYAFGNGGIGVDDPPVVFTVPGTYNVKLKVIRAVKPYAGESFCFSQTNEEYKSGYINVPYTAPKAEFTTNGTIRNISVQAGTTLIFKALDGVNYNYPTDFRWRSSESATTYSTQSISLPFNEVGFHTITLTSYNPAGNTTVSHTVNVTPKAPATDFTVNGSASPIQVVQNSSVSFRDVSLYQPNSWLWTISGAHSYVSNTSGTSQNPSVSFSQLGAINVSLKATNTGGAVTKIKNACIVVIPPPPTVQSPVEYCAGAAAVPLKASGLSGAGFKWYTTESGGTGSSSAPTPGTGVAGMAYYYVSQTVSGLESPRQTIAVKVNALPSKPVVVPSLVYCTGSAAPPLQATGTNLRWYTVSSGGASSSNPIVPSTASPGVFNYYVTQTDARGCESQRAVITVQVVNSLPLPTAVSPVSYCLNAESFPLQANTTLGSGLAWYTVATGGTMLPEAPAPLTDASGTANYYVAQTHPGCAEGPRARVQVITGTIETPALPAIVTPVAYDQNQDVVPLTAEGSGLRWYRMATGGTASAFAPVPQTGAIGTESFYVTQTVNGCESRRAQIEVVTKPGLPVPPPQWTSVAKFPQSYYVDNANISAKNTWSGGGETYTTGGLMGTMAFGNNVSGAPVTLTSTGYIDFYLVRYNESGKVVWANKISANGTSNIVQGIALTKEAGGDDLFITGRFTGTVTFGSTTLTSNQSVVNVPDIFIARYDTSGKCLWAKKAGGPSVDEGYAISVGNGGIYITGKLGNGATFGTVTAPDNLPVFLAKYDFNGNAKWVVGEYVKQSGYGYAVTSDREGNSTISSEGLIAHYDDKGNQLWKKRLSVVDGKGGPFGNTSLIWYATGYTLKTDAEQNIYIAGIFYKSINFDESHKLTSTEGGNAFLVKYNKTGSVVWARKAGGLNGASMRDICIDEYGNIYGAGHFSGLATFGGITVTSSGSRYPDIFIVKYGPQGNEIWVKPTGGTQTDIVNTLNIDKRGTLYLTGLATAAAFDAVAPSHSGFFQASIGGNITKPGIFSLQPSAVYPGEKIGIIGKGLLNTESVVFNGNMPTDFTVQSQSAVVTSVPHGAVSGKVTVTTPAGSDSAAFTIKSYNDEDFPAPNWRWAEPLSGNKNTGVLTDARGYTYLFMPESLRKYDSVGKIVWSKPIQGSLFLQVSDIQFDKEGMIVCSANLLGGQSSTLTVGETTLQGLGFCLMRFDTSGKVLWATKTNGTGTVSGTNTTVDNANNIIIAGTFNGNVDFNGIQFSTSIYSNQKFLAKYTKDGQILSATDGQAPSFAFGGAGLQTDALNHIFVIEKNAVPGLYNSKAINLLKFSPDHIKIWEKQLAVSADYFGIDDVSCVKLLSDKEGNLIISGYYNGATEIGGVTLESSEPGNQYFRDVYAAKFDKNGERIWVRKLFASTWQSSYWTGNNSVSDIQLDSAGNLYATGMFYGTITFGTKQLTASRNDGWLAKFDANGNGVWATQIKSLIGAESNPGRLHVFGTDKLSGSGQIFNGDVQFSDTTITAGSNETKTFVGQLLPPLPPPVITDFSPQQGAAGEMVTIDGTKFLNASEVRFNGTPALEFTINSSKQITAKVPAGAATGTIVVTTPNGVAKASADFSMMGKSSGVIELCPGSSPVLVSSIQGSNCQWQVDMGAGFVNITNAEQYKDFTTTTMTVKDAPANMYGYKYRCIVNGSISEVMSLRFVSHWTGSVSDDWNDLGNWGCANRLPDVNTDVFISTGTVQVRSNVLVRSLTVSPGVKLTVTEESSLEVIKNMR